MSCETMRERIVVGLTDELSPVDPLTTALWRAELERHLAECAACTAYVTDIDKLWRELDDEAVPSERLRRRFTNWLATEGRAMGAGAKVTNVEAVRAKARPTRPAFERWLPLAATLLFGVGIGYVVRAPQQHELDRLRGEVTALHETVAESLLAQASVSKRLKGVAYGREFSNDDAKIADALIAALRDDASVNVRLAAVEALAPLAASSGRSRELVAAVAVQQSPLVQLSLIDLLLDVRDEEVTRALERLVGDPRLEAAVSAYLRDRLMTRSV